MLALPEKGVRVSKTVHNINWDIFCDWIEASSVFVEDSLSKTDVIDVLMENQIYTSQDFAKEGVDIAWDIIRKRVSYIQSPLGLNISSTRISRNSEWTTFPSYGFCLAISCGLAYSGWKTNHLNDYSTQGTLFEEISFHSFSHQFQGWKVEKIGWSPQNPVKLRDIIGELIGDICEKEGPELNTHIDSSTNELGLDLIAYRSFDDGNASFPLMFVQCASGENWIDKRHTPDLITWEKIISFNSCPVKGMTIPFALAEESSFRRHTLRVKGIFLDRYRLLGSFTRNGSDVPDELNTRLINWLAPKITNMPRADI